MFTRREKERKAITQHKAKLLTVAEGSNRNCFKEYARNQNGEQTKPRSRNPYT
uniref:Uncharacterized protein n=1 Tax=Rhizophora mucronata TaxID=61149 RepID=A0A2P2LCI1_RHIMU